MTKTGWRRGLTAHVLLSTSLLTQAALAGSWIDVEALKETIAKTGTRVAEKACAEKQHNLITNSKKTRLIKSQSASIISTKTTQTNTGRHSPTKPLTSCRHVLAIT